MRASVAFAAALGVLAGCVSCSAGGSQAQVRALTTRALTTVTWRASDPGTSVVFGADSVRIFDGCDGALRAADIGDGVLEIGKSIGAAGGCSPVSTWPPPTIARFDRVLAGHHFTWLRAGRDLRITDARGETLVLHASGPALNVQGQHWTLKQFNDVRGYTQDGSNAHLVIDGGSLRADAACAQVIGHAAVTDTTITFTDLRWTSHVCPDQASISLAEVMRRVLSGTIRYSFFGDELLLQGHGPELLAYAPSTGGK